MALPKSIQIEYADGKKTYTFTLARVVTSDPLDPPIRGADAKRIPEYAEEALDDEEQLVATSRMTKASLAKTLSRHAKYEELRLWAHDDHWKKIVIDVIGEKERPLPKKTKFMKPKKSK